MSDAQPDDPLSGFFKNLIGSMGMPLPGLVTPTLDTDELSKRITELKTVEAWLRTNLHLLQATIQSLELQRNTWQAMSGFTQAASQAAQDLNNPFSQLFSMSWLSGNTPPESQTPASPSSPPSPPSTQAQSPEPPPAASAADARPDKPVKKSPAPRRKKTQPSSPAAA